MNIILFIVFVFCWIGCPSLAFVPIKPLGWLLKVLDLKLEALVNWDSVITHKEMTRTALLKVAAELLIDNPNLENKDSSSQIDALEIDFSERELILAYYGKRYQENWVDMFKVAIKEISDANGDVDLGEERNKAAAHFDSEQFQSGQNRLVEKRRNVASQVMARNFELARQEFGRMLHTLQDFYSHSNWVENGYFYPNPLLGKANERLDVVSSNTQTCIDCENTTTNFVISGIINMINQVVPFQTFGGAPAITPYFCQNNIISHLKRNGLLTSGYAAHATNEQGKIINKPLGKCSHGGFFDTTSLDHAKGGINKDSPFKVWSPHHNLYWRAIIVAQRATNSILRDIRSDVNNDTLFGSFLGLSLDRECVDYVTMTYVVDTTSSMDGELPKIREALSALCQKLKRDSSEFNNMRIRYILVPYNDPGMLSFFVVFLG